MTAIADCDASEAVVSAAIVSNGASGLAPQLAARLAARAAGDRGYWNFEGNDQRRRGHGLFSYPAMMVPQLQGALLDDLLAIDPAVRCVYDPFAGAGTVLIEAMMRGLDFVGTDLNPLALLLMQAKSRPLSTAILRKATREVLTAAGRDPSRIDVDFSGRDKWFTSTVASQLSALRRGIRRWPGRDVRRFLWVCLAETVRLVSNSRTSTFKLHAYSVDVLAARSHDAFNTFESVARANTAQLESQRQTLLQAGLLDRGRYRGDLRCLLADVREALRWPLARAADVLMTSPPYGDNRTTVPYGQHAFLPLQWIDTADLSADPRVPDLIATPYRTDVASLGGRRAALAPIEIADLLDRSPQLRRIARSIGKLPGDGHARLIAFCADLDTSIGRMLQRLRPGAFIFWTLGERRITGVRIPMTRIVSELCGAHGAGDVVTLTRKIPNNAKRMALRNDTVSTMRTESILIQQMPAAPAGAANPGRAAPVPPPGTIPTPSRLR